MKNLIIIILILLASDALAQHATPASQDTSIVNCDDTLFTLSQESIVPNDSGGRWVQTNILLKSCSAFPVHVYGFPLRNSYIRSCAPLYDSKPADSAWLLADSLMVLGNAGPPISYGTPWKYKNSLNLVDSLQYYGKYPVFQFVIPPHGTLRIPYLFRFIGAPYFSYLITHDTVDASSWFFSGYGFQWFSDSVGGPWKGVQRRRPYYTYENPRPIYVIAPCSAPYVVSSNGTWSNQQSPVVPGQNSPWYFSYTDTTIPLQTTKTNFKIVGEYSDRFVPPLDTEINCGYPVDIHWTFNGAPKSVVHDTLVSTFSDLWGTVVTRTPIEAYSIYPDGYQIHQFPLDLKSPFLGRAEGNVGVVRNTSNFPITLRNLRAVSYNDSMDFEVSSPAMIAAHDSGYIAVTLKDKNLYLDTSGTNRSATITGIIAPYQQDFEFKDSTFSISVSGSIDVYSPLYFSLIPVLKHGVHPAGIIFTSSVSSLSGPGTFLTVYGNNDPTTEYFGMPYYDDPHFTFAISDYLGFGTATLPGNVNPDTGFIPTNIQVLTTFTGDSYHNYFTQMHWPRATDTITIDVVALGENAPPLDGVTYASEPRSVSLWPNPASTILHIRSGDPTDNFRITDILGRVIRTGKGTESSIDISDLPTGLYVLSFSKLGESIKFQILR